MKIKLYNILLIVFVVLSSVSCEEMTEYSPYDANTFQHDVNAQNISEILEKPQVTDSLVFIAISDTHADYSELRKAVTTINKMEGVSFVVICGDITNLALYSEFDNYYHLINRLNIPFITIIGNHDYLSNGKLIYNKMFGPTSFYFDIGYYRMVIFDNVVWENGNNEPDFNWLQKTLQVPEGMTSIVCYHIHPWDSQLENGYAVKMQDIIEGNPVSLSVFGHGHGMRDEIHNNRQYLLIPDIGSQRIIRISLKNKVANYKVINY